MSNKIRVKKVVKIEKKLTQDESVAHISSKVDRFIVAVELRAKQLTDKHNELATQISEISAAQQNIATFAATEFGKMLAQIQLVTTEFGRSINHLDFNLLALVELTKEVFGQLAQIDHVLSKNNLSTEVPEEDIAGLKEKAENWHNDVIASAFSLVTNRLAAEEVVREEALAEAKEQEEAQAAELATALTDTAEVVRAEAELRRAESTGIIQQGGGGAGSNIPEGADVFGG